MAAAWFQKLLDPVAARLQERLAEVSEVVEEGVAGFPRRQGLRRRAGGEGPARRALPSRFAGKPSRSERLRATFNPMLDLLPMVALVTVLYVGGKDAIDGSLTVGDLVAFSALLLQLVFPLRMTSYVVAQIARASASAARVQEVMVTEPRDRRRRVRADDLRPDPARCRSPVCRSRTTAVADVLRDFDLEIAGGESVALVGPTGCGKSTVARLIPRFYDVAVGSVRIDGHDVRAVRLGFPPARDRPGVRGDVPLQ